ncbi:lysosomal acid glucosylceramidase-like [Oratosquilla oratoria]|uniref:lysosomal acid glucosylceramidase-like n=1 Tax=Oratosquilla oratoria TaxID=337810 RepID=UPI003F7711C7
MELSFAGLLLLAWAPLGIALRPCAPRDFGHSSVVCVCNATFCDDLPEAEVPLKGHFNVYTSSMRGSRFELSQGTFLEMDILHEVSNNNLVRYELDYSNLQSIVGWGTAVTDSASLNLLSLSHEAQENLLKSYFTEAGIALNMIRTNIAGCDFSTRPYTYNDMEDVTLRTFALQEEDTKYKIPTMHRAMAMSERQIKIVGSPWSAPAWMKTNNALTGFGQLKEEMYQPWANYIVKFLDEYARHNVSIWGITAQNEPRDGYIPYFFFNCMGWTAEQQRLWIAEYLGPLLETRGYAEVKVMILDDQRLNLPKWARTVLSDPKAARYVDGVALHWYTDMANASLLAETYHEFPDHFLLATEACEGMFETSTVKLGDWSRGENYAGDIIEDVNNFVTGWIDWNFALDMSGGPNWAKNFVDSAVIVNPDNDEFYKNPMYYALGHFSKFVPEGSRRNRMKNLDEDDLVETAAFTTPDGTHVLVVLNRNDIDVDLRVSTPGRGVLALTSTSRSIQTILFV